MRVMAPFAARARDTSRSRAPAERAGTPPVTKAAAGTDWEARAGRARRFGHSLVQALPALNARPDDDAAPEAIREAAAAGIRTAPTELPHAEKIAASFGEHRPEGVTAHVGGEATESAQAMNADAFTTSEHIVFAGRPDLHTAAHEAAHVVQQRHGVDVPDGVGRSGDAFERHADAVADRVVAGRSAEDLLNGVAPE